MKLNVCRPLLALLLIPAFACDGNDDRPPPKVSTAPEVLTPQAYAGVMCGALEDFMNALTTEGERIDESESASETEQREVLASALETSEDAVILLLGRLRGSDAPAVEGGAEFHSDFVDAVDGAREIIADLRGEIAGREGEELERAQDKAERRMDALPRPALRGEGAPPAVRQAADQDEACARIDVLIASSQTPTASP